MKKDILNYLIIIIFGTVLAFFLLGSGNIYGSTTDWISQHSIFPDYLRTLFYETGNILPNMAYHLGAGQNIFSVSYYGLLSPVILISYLLPNVSMTTFICTASIVLYILSGILLYYFFKNKTKKSTALFLSLVLLSASPLTYHFHHHIMFVWYIPFLILSLIGVDRYISKNKSLLLILSIFLLIMTNYYYSVTSLIVIVIYGVYKLLDKDNFNLITFLLDVLRASLRVILGIALAGIILLPTAYIVKNTGRILTSSNSLIELFTPNFHEITYKTFSMGITGLFLLAPLGLLCKKKLKKSEVFLSITLLLISLIPVFMYTLNGFLYIRGKVLIPFIVLYIFILSLFIQSLSKKEINLRNFAVIIFIILLSILAIDYTDKTHLFLCLDIILSFSLCLIYNKFKTDGSILIPLIVLLVSISISNNESENYVTKEYYETINTKDVTNLVDKLPSDGYYRTTNNYYYLENANKIYNTNYYSTSIYSSNYNNYYWNFYNFEIGNNIKNRNAFVSSGTNNLIFNTLMGVKYIISDKDIGNYEKIAESNDLSLYENKYAYPLVYTTNKTGSIKNYESLKFPYNAEYMLNNPVVDTNKEVNYKSSIKKIASIKDKKIKLDEKTKYTYKLPETIKNKILIIDFDMEYNATCNEGDTYITINGVKNKLTCSSWMYHNNNNHFEYVISSNKSISNLYITMTKGKFELSNINIYTMDYKPNNYQELSNLNIDLKKSTITGISKEETDSYLITSIPYDEGFTTYVDDLLVDKEIVNKAFLGFKIPAGEHQIKIEYHSPWLSYGIILSILGIMGTIAICIYERFKNMIDKIIKNNKEIIMYLVFGGLTTLISIIAYYLCVSTFLNASDKIELQIANIISWIISVTFAYVTNRLFVFTSKNKNILKESIKFYSSRLLTLGIDMILMFILVSLLGLNDLIIKIIVQVIVIVANYILSKLIVFKKEGK